MDTLSVSTFEPMCLSRNPIEINIEAMNTNAITRAGIRYYLSIYLPAYYRASIYQNRATQEGSEQPPYNLGSTKIFPGATFSIEQVLDSLLELKRPVFAQNKISVCDKATINFYTVWKRTQGTTIETGENQTSYVLKGGINEAFFAEWKDNFFTQYIGVERKFLTFQPNNRLVRPESPEYLYWLSNISPLPTAIRLRARITYEDTTIENLTITELNGITGFTVYCVPVGALALALDIKEKVVSKYEVWLSDQSNQRLTEIRTFILDYTYKRNVKYIIFQNSIGGYDTICMTGQSTETIRTEKQIFEREPLYDHLPTYAERIVNKVKGTKELAINTGFFSKSEHSTFADLMLSKDVMLVTDREYIPLLIKDDSLQLTTDDEKLIGREIIFEYSNKIENVSPLPISPTKIQRPTAWRPHEFGGCVIDVNGKRTGFQQVNLLERYYTDNSSSVRPAEIKPNTPDTEGYIPAVQSSNCSVATTPFVSIGINRIGSFNKNNCPVGQFGSKPTVRVAPATYGSERSQDDADQKAEAAWARLNTQDYANDPANGAVCSVSPESYYVNGVPAGRFNYRWYDKSGGDSGSQIYGSSGAYSASNSDIIYGVGWATQNNTNPQSIMYQQGSNDCSLPCDYNTGPYGIILIGYNVSKRIKIYYNGILKLDRTISIQEFTDNSYTMRITLSDSLVPVPNQCMMYILVETL